MAPFSVFVPAVNMDSAVNPLQKANSQAVQGLFLRSIRNRILLFFSTGLGSFRGTYVYLCIVVWSIYLQD